jgi:acylphosphatase
MKEHYNIKVRGNVQGVYFRDSAWKKAEELGISGFVRNEPDGAVYMEAEGGKEALESFLEWAKSGPVAAKVEKVEVSEGEVKNFFGFVIK